MPFGVPFVPALLYGRMIRVTLIPTTPGKYRAGSLTDAIVIESLDAQFKIKKDLSSNPNPGSISIKNISPATRGKLNDKNVRIILEAGYPSTIGQIYSGDATHIDHVHDGSDWTTKIECGDGARAFQFARVNMSFGDNTPAGRVVKKVVGMLGIDPGNLDEQAQALQRNYQNGYSASGRAADEMNRLMKAAGLEWSIQDGRLQVLKPGQATNDQAIDLTPDSGLIGSVEHGTPPEKGGPAPLKARSLLNPTFRPGALVNITSANQNGTFRITTAEFSGDTQRGDWYTDLEVTKA